MLTKEYGHSAHISFGRGGGIDLDHGLDVNLNLFNDKLGRKVFLPHPSSPAKRGYSKTPLSITFSSISLQISE